MRYVPNHTFPMLFLALVLVVSLLGLTACGDADPADGDAGDVEQVEPGAGQAHGETEDEPDRDGELDDGALPDGAPGEPTEGTQPAPGLYDLSDGTVRAIGTLVYRDLEGGFWAIVADEGGEDETVAVIANGGEFVDTLDGLAGRTVSVAGRRIDGVSIRMAGPEIEIDDISAYDPGDGAAD